MNEQELRRWAIEQAIALHGRNGVDTATLVLEAQRLIDYVLGAAPPRR